MPVNWKKMFYPGGFRDQLALTRPLAIHDRAVANTLTQSLSRKQ